MGFGGITMIEILVCEDTQTAAEEHMLEVVTTLKESGIFIRPSKIFTGFHTANCMVRCFRRDAVHRCRGFKADMTYGFPLEITRQLRKDATTNEGTALVSYILNIEQKWLLEKEGTMIVSWDFSEGKDANVLNICKIKNKKITVIKSLRDDAALDMYAKLCGDQASVKGEL